MKGLVLAGGRGTRLRPITHTSAKQLVPVANKPILFYGLDHLVAAGITDIGIVVGETAAEVEAAVGDGSRWGIRVTYLHQPEPLGLAHAVAVARTFLGEDDFAMYLGDNMLQEGVSGMVQAFTADRARAAATGARPPAASILLCPVPDPQRFGVAELDGDRIVRLVEKPEHPVSDLALAGVYLFGPEVHEAVATLVPSPRGELEIVDALQWLLDHHHPVHHALATGWWLDTGKKDSLLEANRRVLDTIVTCIEGTVDRASDIDGRVVLEAGAQVEGSTIRGPATIGAGCRVVRSYVGPYTSIGPGTVIEDSEVEDSVLLDDVVLRGVPRLIDSLVGTGSLVTRTGRPPVATRLLLGDHCSVDLR